MGRNTLIPGLIAGAFLVSGCTLAEIEYDRMTGTSYPLETTVAGDAVNLSTIYMQGDRLVTVDEDTTNIAALTGPFNAMDPDQYDYITLAEIETVELANRASPISSTSFSCGWNNAYTCTRYYLYGIVVDHFEEESDGTRDENALGLMYAGASGTTNDRSAFVSYWKNTDVSTNNDKYLRSTAHEVGHGFNLNHCDGDGSTTIMNTTGTVGAVFSFEFSATSLDHLQNHDDDVVWPGTGSRDYACPHVH